MFRFLIIFIGVILFARVDVYTYSVKLNYKEYVNGNVIDRDYSSFSDILGVGVKYSDRFYYLKGEYASGRSTYEGSNTNGDYLKNRQNGVYILNVEGGIGNYFYLIFGYRKWNRGKSDYVGDYNEVYYWKYWGIKYAYPFKFEDGSFIPEAGYRLAIDPKMKAELGSGAVFNLGVTSGTFIELPFIFKYNNNLSFKFFYRYEAWLINPSDEKEITIDNKTYIMFEPESFTQNQYLGVGLVWNF